MKTIYFALYPTNKLGTAPQLIIYIKIMKTIVQSRQIIFL